MLPAGANGSGSVPDPVYVPILKGRQGEFGALKQIQQVTRQSILPLIEIVPAPSDDRNALKQLINRTAKKLGLWAGDRLLLDAGLLPTDVEISNGLGAVGFSAAAAMGEFVKAIPVVRLNDEVQAHLDAAAVNVRHANGIAIRLNAEDLDEDSEDIEVALSDLLVRLGADPSEVDLILDLGVVVGDLGVRAGSRIVADAVRGLSSIEDWRLVIVTAGAFPSDLSAFGPWTVGEPIRYDAAFYDHLQQRKRLARMPVFGDYAIAHPLLATGPAFPPAPQLRYTVAERWLTLKGARNDPRGNEQFYEVCEIIARHPEFAGSGLGSADERIANPRKQGPGNASTWREIGTTHHLDFVVQRITTLGEP